MASKEASADKDKDKKTHKLSLKGSARLVAEFVSRVPPLTPIITHINRPNS